MMVVIARKNVISKTNSVSEIQASDSNCSTDIEDNYSMGWRSLLDIATSEDSDSCDTDENE